MRTGLQAQNLERDHEDGVPTAGFAGGGAVPACGVAYVLAGLLVAHAARRRLEKVHAASGAARIDADAHEIVLPEAEVVGGLIGDDRDAGLLGVEGDVEFAAVVEQIDARRERGVAAFGEISEGVGLDLSGLPGGVGEGGIEGHRVRGADGGEGEGRRDEEAHSLDRSGGELCGQSTARHHREIVRR